jgi:hypothetical protein
MAFPPSSKQLPHIAAFFLFSLTVSTLAQAPPGSCGECASRSAVWCTNLPYPRFIGTQGRCLPLGQNYTNCIGFQFYVPPGFNTCEYVLRTADAPLPFVIEEWYHPLHFFGACSDWRESAMTLIADYTYSISLRGCKLHQPFMFVPVLFGGNEVLCPKLGCKNWKQGKVGLGAVSLSGAALQPGGGSGFLPASGDYNMTLYTNHSDPDLRFSVKFNISGMKPSIVVSGPKSVTNATSFPVVITASHVCHLLSSTNPPSHPALLISNHHCNLRVSHVIHAALTISAANHLQFVLRRSHVRFTVIIVHMGPDIFSGTTSSRHQFYNQHHCFQPIAFPVTFFHHHHPCHKLMHVHQRIGMRPPQTTFFYHHLVPSQFHLLFMSKCSCVFQLLRCYRFQLKCPTIRGGKCGTRRI